MRIFHNLVCFCFPSLFFSLLAGKYKEVQKEIKTHPLPNVTLRKWHLEQDILHGTCELGTREQGAKEGDSEGRAVLG